MLAAATGATVAEVRTAAPREETDAESAVAFCELPMLTEEGPGAALREQEAARLDDAAAARPAGAGARQETEEAAVMHAITLVSCCWAITQRIWKWRAASSRRRDGVVR